MIIVIEGGDQAGKKTQTELLSKALKKRKIKTTTFSFPDYTTPIGKEIAKYLAGKRKFPPQTIHCLLAANRWEKLNHILLAQSKNSVLIMNRYYQSNLVYGLANGMKQSWLENLDAGLPKADLVILLDVSQKESFNRKKSNRDKFEKNEEFLKKISKIYRNTAKKKKMENHQCFSNKSKSASRNIKNFFKKNRVMKKNYLDIIDPIHDFIRVYDHELEIIDNPIFQRLRRIRQLSGAHLTYPAAQHTRFEHSLGVMHIASQAGQVLEEKEILKSDDIEILRLAGLLHDIGHGPFSHLFEEIIQQKKLSHEDFGKKLILKSIIGDKLSKNGYDKKLISKIAFGDSKYQYLNEIVSGALSADMMDYLLRDGYFTGAEHAKIDHKRLTQSLDVHKKKLALERSALYSFESMMHSRYQMFKAVYFHKTVRAAEVMLLEALRLSDDEFGFTSFDMHEYVKLTDEYVLSMLLSSKSSKLRKARKFAEDYQNRKLLKCVFERILTSKTLLEKIKTNEIRSLISKKSKIDEDEIFVDSSVTPSIPLAPSKKESKKIILITNENGKSQAQELDISEIPVVSAISGFMNILRVYTPQKNRKKVEIAAKSILGDLK
jgi:dTMP kinase